MSETLKNLRIRPKFTHFSFYYELQNGFETQAALRAPLQNYKVKKIKIIKINFLF